MFKKTLCLFLSVFMLLGLCACGQDNGPALQVGYYQIDITPQTSVPMGGYGNSGNRLSEGTSYPLKATCIAFTYGEEKLLLFTQDLMKSTWTDLVRPMISSATGVPADRIMICSTHNHHGPDLDSSDASIATYRTLYSTAFVQAATKALEDCAPATLYAGKTQTESLSFIRHYLLSDGSYGGDNFGDFTTNTIKGYSHEADQEMIVLKIEREGKKDIGIVNWQAHLSKTKGDSANRLISSDFVGPMRSYFEALSGMHFAYFTGSAGDLKTTSLITEDNNDLDLVGLGEKLADIAYAAMENAQKLEGQGIKVAKENHQYDVSHEGEDKLAQAQEVVNLKASTGSVSDANALARKYGLSSVYEAEAIVNRINRPLTQTYELNAVYVAGFAFVTAPYEMYSPPAKYVKGNSPFETTMVFAYANGHEGYFPTEAAYDYRSFEATSGYYAKGCAEDSAEAMLTLLKGLQ